MENTIKKIDYFRKHIVDIIIGITAVVYILWGIVSVQESGKTVYEILATALVSLAMGISFTSLLGEKGLNAGYESDAFKITKNDYSKVVGSISNNVDKVDMWCDLKIKMIIKRKQTKLLTRARIKYNVYISDDFNPKNYDKRQRKLIYKADNVSVYNMTATHLLSNIEEDDDTDKKEITISKYKYQEFRKGIFIRILFAIVFGYFVVKIAEDPAWSNIIYYSAQICIWLLFATMQYFSNYGFVINTLSQVIERKTNNLSEFKIWCENNSLRSAEPPSQTFEIKDQP